MRPIDGDTLLAEYDRLHEGPPGKARTLIENAPTIEPEKKRGKWFNEDTEKMECNCCHHVFDSSSLMNADDEYFWDYPNFCPNCGADMRGEQDYGMIKIKGEGTLLDWQIINSIKDISVKNIEFKNIIFECETIIDAAGHVFVRQESKEKQNETD